MSYFDTHAHYDWKEFDKDREELFDKFKEKEIDKVNKYYFEENMLNAVKLLKEHQTKNRRLEEFEVDEK